MGAVRYRRNERGGGEEEADDGLERRSLHRAPVNQPPLTASRLPLRRRRHPSAIFLLLLLLFLPRFPLGFLDRHRHMVLATTSMYSKWVSANHHHHHHPYHRHQRRRHHHHPRGRKGRRSGCQKHRHSCLLLPPSIDPSLSRSLPDSIPPSPSSSLSPA